MRFRFDKTRSRITNRPYNHANTHLFDTQNCIIIFNHLKCLYMFSSLFVSFSSFICRMKSNLTSSIVKISLKFDFYPLTDRERERDQRGRFSREGRNSCPNEPGIYVSIEAWRHFDGIICRIQSYTRRFRRILCTIRPLRHRIFSRRI